MSNQIDGNFQVVPNDPPAEYELPSEDSVQAYVHQKRIQLVNTLVVKGIPDDHESRTLLLTALKDMDSSALSRKKIASDNKNTAQSAAAAAIIAKVLERISNNSKSEAVSTGPYVAPTLGDDVPPPSLIEGETATQLPQQSYEAFMSKFADPDEPK